MVNAFLKAIYDKLKGDSDLMTKVGGNANNLYKCHNILAPQSATLPYIVFGLLTDMPMGVFGKLDDMEDATFYLNIYSSTGPKNAGEILDLVKAVLDDADLTISGYTNDMYCMREYIGTTSYNPDTKAWMIPMRYRVIAEKN